MLYTFLAEILYTLDKVAYQSTNLVKLHVSRRKSEILVFDGFLLSKWYQVKTKKGQKKYQLKKYRRVISHDTVQGYKV